MTNKENPGPKANYSGHDFPRRFIGIHQQIETKKHPEAKSDGAEQKNTGPWEKASIIVTAVATVVIAIATIATVCVTIHHAKIFSQQLIAMNKQIDAMNYEQRPWMAVPEIRIETPLVKDKENATITIMLAAKNVGRTPAQTITILTESAPKPDWAPITDALCEQANARQNFHVIPGDQFVVHKTLEFKISEIAQLAPQIAGCVIYGSQFDTKPHRTGFVATISASDPTKIDAQPIKFGVSNVIEPQELRVMHIYNGRYAD